MTSVAARRFVVVSDLHLGRPGALLACCVPDAEIAEALEALRDSETPLIVNGDLFDLERGVVPFAFQHELRLVSHEYPKTMRALGEGEVWSTSGNHDRERERDGSVTRWIEVSTPAGPIRVEHGDRFNAPIKRWPLFTSLVTWASGRAVATPALHPVYRMMHGLDQALTGATVAAEEPIAAAAAGWLGTKRGLAGMVIGHTHAPILKRLADGRLLMNPGGSTDVLHALRVDGEAATATLLRWRTGGWEAWHDAPLRT
ncbi:MAG: metallophosphoesterase [Myxococcales bacterium]|nr:metallophosphoesterase [Myxococcales bacterium]MCB9532255.1 metallophosphoesterase [Myxococcales bacterium]MCB9533919.1 metallophosphoesterase [Myxococcales bacterium]